MTTSFSVQPDLLYEQLYIPNFSSVWIVFLHDLKPVSISTIVGKLVTRSILSLDRCTYILPRVVNPISG